MNNFKVGDIVIFSWKPNYAPWRKGKIVAISNNVSMSNTANFVGKPEYYVTYVDVNNNIIDSKQLFAIDKNSEYILKFLPGMEAMIGKNTYYTESMHIFDNEKKLPEHDADEDYVRCNNQFKNVSKDDEQEWKEKIERKLDDINDKLIKLLSVQRPLPVETPSSPCYDTNKTYPWWDTSKVYCDDDLKNYKYVYESNIASEE